MKQSLRRLAAVFLRIGLRAMPWAVSVGAVAFGGWFFSALLPIASDSRLAAVGISVILLRATAAVVAVSAGAFALAAGLEGRWFPVDGISRRRFAGLAALGATSLAVGTFIVAGPLVGFSIARSLAVVGAAGFLAGLAAWSTWSLRRSARDKAPPLVLDAPRVTDDWFSRDLGRVKTPAT